MGQTSTSTSIQQTQPQKHITNLLLPVSIPQPTEPPKQNMFNLKFNNGPTSTENKGGVTGENNIQILQVKVMFVEIVFRKKKKEI